MYLASISTTDQYISLNISSVFSIPVGSWFASSDLYELFVISFPNPTDSSRSYLTSYSLSQITGQENSDESPLPISSLSHVWQVETPSIHSFILSEETATIIVRHSAKDTSSLYQYSLSNGSFISVISNVLEHFVPTPCPPGVLVSASLSPTPPTLRVHRYIYIPSHTIKSHTESPGASPSDSLLSALARVPPNTSTFTTCKLPDQTVAWCLLRTPVPPGTCLSKREDGTVRAVWALACPRGPFSQCTPLPHALPPSAPTSPLCACPCPACAGPAATVAFITLPQSPPTHADITLAFLPLPPPLTEGSPDGNPAPNPPVLLPLMRFVLPEGATVTGAALSDSGDGLLAATITGTLAGPGGPRPWTATGLVDTHITTMSALAQLIQPEVASASTRPISAPNGPNPPIPPVPACACTHPQSPSQCCGGSAQTFRQPQSPVFTVPIAYPDTLTTCAQPTDLDLDLLLDDEPDGPSTSPPPPTPHTLGGAQGDTASGPPPESSPIDVPPMPVRDVPGFLGWAEVQGRPATAALRVPLPVVGTEQDAAPILGPTAPATEPTASFPSSLAAVGEGALRRLAWLRHCKAHPALAPPPPDSAGSSPPNPFIAFVSSESATAESAEHAAFPQSPTLTLPPPHSIEADPCAEAAARLTCGAIAEPFPQQATDIAATATPGALVRALLLRAACAAAARHVTLTTAAPLSVLVSGCLPGDPHPTACRVLDLVVATAPASHSDSYAPVGVLTRDPNARAQWPLTLCAAATAAVPCPGEACLQFTSAADELLGRVPIPRQAPDAPQA